MKQNFTSISVVLDRSGSMNSIITPTIEGFNEFIQQQRGVAEGECVVSLHQFDDQYQTDYQNKAIADVAELNVEFYVPRGTTALLDAIGKTIDDLGKSLSDMDESERPDTVIVAILTDGHENASRDFTIRQINEMIKHQTDVYDWEFVFLGANQDAIATAARYGIERRNAMTYSASDRGTRAAFERMGDGLMRKRHAKAEAYHMGRSTKQAALMSKLINTFNEEDRREQEDIDKEK